MDTEVDFDNNRRGGLPLVSRRVGEMYIFQGKTAGAPRKTDGRLCILSGAEESEDFGRTGYSFHHIPLPLPLIDS